MLSLTCQLCILQRYWLSLIHPKFEAERQFSQVDVVVLAKKSVHTEDFNKLTTRILTLRKNPGFSFQLIIILWLNKGLVLHI